jgi:hypothetical protein
MGATQTFVIVEGDREISTVGGLLGAALVWSENPGARRVYRTAPIGSVGPDAWQRAGEIAADELRAALPR